MKKNIMMRIASVLLVAVLLSTCAISGTYAKYVTSVTGNDTARVAYWGFQPEEINISDLFAAAYDNDNVQSGEDSGEKDAQQNIIYTDVIAPGTGNDTAFAFDYKPNANSSVTAPEVAYNFTVSVSGSACDPLIQANKNIKWSLDDALAPAAGNYAQGSWGALMSAILSLSGTSVTYVAPDPNGADEAAKAGVVSATESYGPGELPDAFDDLASNGSTIVTDSNDNTIMIETHTISWQWVFDETGATSNNSYTVGNDTYNQNEYDTYMANAANLDDVTIVITITATQVD